MKGVLTGHPITAARVLPLASPVDHHSDIGDEGLNMAIFTAEPGSASQQALDLLAGWTATPSAAANANS